MPAPMPEMPMDPAMGATPPIETPMPEGPGATPESDMIMIDRSSFEDLKEILSGIMAGIDQILAGGPASPESKPEMEEEEEEGEEGEMEEGGAKPSGKSSPTSDDEEFLKILMAEGNKPR